MPRVPVARTGSSYLKIVGIFLIFVGVLIFFNQNPFQIISTTLNIDIFVNIKPIWGLIMMIGGMALLFS
ncbi:MAG: hypothetical protein APG08_00885 [Candidatus Methanofastidiosum methylothiophilum]|jgi:drug/metabolite transporter (DMT)-like permease|uniref:Uncharacterized protein n=1 Tax=Candidatus Methanofastidiosum methylothiophilum TaxID=1705564 RepID=A0A150JLK3_9EURY|nr:MAG: hypothetical protein AN188_00691 [Candidatus Methanofastidiosum methylthiophilus]KYC56557.1 MAG: hypothetical protein APG08_00885 [Candidatus Methanofastidiosum methylthiophilus]KYC58057.1 MAG: hypothetical protein APG09_00557 [Candidatus Methanofastidiosum methylthiophilus]OQC18225.1 MAG: hypothetical protein BWX72_00170 [Firmicutes bacterium ADurb.Bin080]HQG61826.1 hypothetical protein [Methanofastidiosum sp.]